MNTRAKRYLPLLIDIVFQRVSHLNIYETKPYTKACLTIKSPTIYIHSQSAKQSGIHHHAPKHPITKYKGTTEFIKSSTHKKKYIYGKEQKTTEVNVILLKQIRVYDFETSKLKLNQKN